jgi:hypothetical protein
VYFSRSVGLVCFVPRHNTSKYGLILDTATCSSCSMLIIYRHLITATDDLTNKIWIFSCFFSVFPVFAACPGRRDAQSKNRWSILLPGRSDLLCSVSNIHPGTQVEGLTEIVRHVARDSRLLSTDMKPRLHEYITRLEASYNYFGHSFLKM